jgi:hypothetical protein
MSPPGSDIDTNHIITLVDSNPAKTLSSGFMRPPADAGDTYLGLDNTANVGMGSAQLAIGAPVSITEYIGNTGDNVNFLERLTSSLKTFKVPITTNSQITSTLSTGTSPFSITSTTPVANLTVSNHPTIQDCGSTSACANTAKTAAIIVRGSVAFPTASTVSLSSLPFTSASTYTCIGQDTTTAAGVINATTYTSGSAVTFTETNGVNTDTMRYVCTGW